MKRLSVLGLMAFAFTSIAEPQMQGMDPAQLQKLMTDMQGCLQKINMEDMEKLKVRGQAMEQEIKSLCKAGKRDEAMSKTMAFSKEMMNEPGLVQMKKCSDQARSVMPNMKEFDKFSADKFKDTHVCESMK